jgi:hypothetical protein
LTSDVNANILAALRIFVGEISSQYFSSTHIGRNYQLKRLTGCGLLPRGSPGFRFQKTGPDERIIKARLPDSTGFLRPDSSVGFEVATDELRATAFKPQSIKTA